MGAMLTGNLLRSKVYTRRLATTMAVRVAASEGLLAADGEVFDGNADFTVEKHREPLLVYAPEP